MSRIRTATNLALFGLTPSSDVFDNLAAYDFFWQNVDQTDAMDPSGSYAGTQSWTFLDAINTGIKSRNPDAKHGLYIAGGLANARPWDPMADWLTSADALHEPDGTDLVYSNGTFDYVWANYQDDGVRARHIAEYLAFLAEHDLDGLFLDSWSPIVYSWWINGNSGLLDFPGGLREGPLHLTRPWINWLTTWGTELRDALEAEGHALMANGLGPGPDVDDESDAFLGDFGVNTGLYNTATIYEIAHRMYYSASIFAQAMAALRLANATGTEVFALVQPWLFKITDTVNPGVSSTVPYVLGRDLERFYLATYLLWANERSYFGYSENIAYFGTDDGVTVARVFRSDDWDLDFGEPTGHSFDGGTTLLWWRQYTRGYAVVNPTANALRFAIPGTYGVWDPSGDGNVTITSDASTHLRLDPYTGVFLFESGALAA